MAKKNVSENFDPANPNSYRSFDPFDPEMTGEPGPFQRLYDTSNALESLARIIDRGRTSIVSEMPNETEQSGLAHIVKALSREVHDAAAWVQDHYQPEGEHIAIAMQCA